MKVSVIVPTLNAERWISRQLDSLLSQTVEAEIIVIDSGSTDATGSIVRARADRVRLMEIPREDFDHGGTRDYALRQSAGDFVCFLTQDALPTDERCLEHLLSAFSSPDIAAVYGRQIAYLDAPEYERLTRVFNYPEQPRIWREADIPRYGVKSYFFSNVCAAYRRDAYLAAGGFDAPILCNEDMMMAAKLLHKGYALAYTPDRGCDPRTNAGHRVSRTLPEYRRCRLLNRHPAPESRRREVTAPEGCPTAAVYSSRRYM